MGIIGEYNLSDCPSKKLVSKSASLKEVQQAVLKQLALVEPLLDSFLQSDKT